MGWFIGGRGHTVVNGAEKRWARFGTFRGALINFNTSAATWKFSDDLVSLLVAAWAKFTFYNMLEILAFGKMSFEGGLRPLASAVNPVRRTKVSVKADPILF